MNDQQRARELLAAEYERVGSLEAARSLRANDAIWNDSATVAAIASALATAALRAAPEGFVLVPVVSVVPCDCGCHRHCCRYCGYDLGGLAPLAARPQGVKDAG